mmetsp:Transcript_113519/g.315798  ORF Transcript_113519/g.315798 Transcript_113519/m.315798 type:complete len:274 (+) Transcript_113519:37-858(+)
MSSPTGKRPPGRGKASGCCSGKAPARPSPRGRRGPSRWRRLLVRCPLGRRASCHPTTPQDARQGPCNAEHARRGRRRAARQRRRARRQGRRPGTRAPEASAQLRHWPRCNAHGRPPPIRRSLRDEWRSRSPATTCRTRRPTPHRARPSPRSLVSAGALRARPTSGHSERGGCSSSRRPGRQPTRRRRCGTSHCQREAPRRRAASRASGRASAEARRSSCAARWPTAAQAQTKSTAPLVGPRGATRPARYRTTSREPEIQFLRPTRERARQNIG